MKFKKAVAVFLAIVVLFSVMAVSSFAENEKLNYVVLGDSISYGSGIYNSNRACYGRIVADTNGYNYTNYGVPGSRTVDLIDMLGHSNIAESVKQADIISISIGGNDFLRQNMPKIFAQVTFGNYQIPNDIQKLFAERFDIIISTIKELNPDAVILVQTLYNPRVDMLRDFYDVGVVRINHSIADYLDEHPGAFEIIDVHSEFTPDHPEFIAFDTIHPSAVGNRVIAKLILEKLYDLNLGENTEPVYNAIGIDQIPFMSFIIKFFRDMITSIA